MIRLLTVSHIKIISGTIAMLLQWMKENILTGKVDLFLQNDTMLVGVLLLLCPQLIINPISAVPES